MQLIGQYDSPFVRRVGIALDRYKMPFEHLPFSTFGDGERFRHLNPLRRVPTLVLDHGEVLFGSERGRDLARGSRIDNGTTMFLLRSRFAVTRVALTVRASHRWAIGYSLRRQRMVDGKPAAGA